MSEAQLLNAGFYLIMISAAALVVYLILSLIMLLIKKKGESGDSGQKVQWDTETDLVETKSFKKEKVSVNTREKVSMQKKEKELVKEEDFDEDDSFDLESKIIGSTEALTNSTDSFNHNTAAYKGFLSKDVREIIIPKNEIMAVKKGMNLPDVLEYMINNDISHCPVFYRSIDDILGVVKLKVLLRKQFLIGDNDIWDECVETPPFISGSISILSAFHQMRQRKSKIAIVIDEYAQTIGIITQDDIICGILNDNK